MSLPHFRQHAGYPLFARFPISALLDSRLTPTELKVLAALHAYARPDSKVQVVQVKIAEMTNLTRNRVANAISGLREKGWLKLITRGREGFATVQELCTPAHLYSEPQATPPAPCVETKSETPFSALDTSVENFDDYDDGDEPDESDYSRVSSAFDDKLTPEEYADIFGYGAD